MSGFDNDVVWCDNWDFRGIDPPQAQVTASGQLPIGTGASPAIEVGSIVAADSSVTIGYSNPNITVAVNSLDAALTITPDSGGAVPPVSNNWNITGLGETSTETSADPNIDILSPRVSSWIVDPTQYYGTHQTITAAMAAASSGDTVWLRPATYTEDWTHKAGVTVIAATGEGYDAQVVIKGKITTAGSGSSSLTGVRLETNGDFGLTMNGGNYYITSCYLYPDDNTLIDLDSGTLRIQDSYWNQNGSQALFDQDGGFLEFYNCIGLINTSATSTCTGGTLRIHWSQMTNVLALDGASTLLMFQSRMPKVGSCVTLSDTSTGIARFCHFNGGTSAAITANGGTTMEIYACNFACSGTTCATGAGTIEVSDVSFDNLTDVIDATTITKIPTGMKITRYTSGDTWTKDWRTQKVHVIGWGGGGGGGSGRAGSSASTRGGGGGGTCQGIFDVWCDATQLGSTETVTIGAGGAGGAGVTAGTSGNNGVAGGVTSFGNIATYSGSVTSYGSGGTGAVGGAGGTAPTVVNNMIAQTGPAGAAGGFAAAATDATDIPDASGNNMGLGGGNAGGGGGKDGGNTAYAGSKGGDVNTWAAAPSIALAGGAAGAVDGAGGAGNTSLADTGGILCGGTGGGGSGAGTTVDSGVGGAGGAPGGGGGGSGAVTSTQTSGTGGAGADGAVWVYEYFF